MDQNGSFAHKLGMKWNFHHKNVAFHPMKKPHETPPEPSLPPGPFMQRKATVRDFTKPVTEILKVAWAVIWILEEKKREGWNGNEYEICHQIFQMRWFPYKP